MGYVSLRERRRATRRRRRARLRAVTVAFVSVVVSTAAALGLLVTSSTDRSFAHPAPTDPLAFPVPAFGVGRHSLLGLQLAAVRRLAARGLPLYCGGPKRRMVALTFDDGPGVYTRLALRRLHAAHAQATFFLVGKEIRAYPALAPLERPLAAFGDHTMTHPFLPALQRAAMVPEITDAEALIERATRQPVALFRPPYEGLDRAIEREAKRLRLLTVLWNIDSADSLGAGYRLIERNVIAGLHAGSIILMHENRGQTIRALPTVLRAVKRRHLRAVTVPELVLADPPSAKQLGAGWRGCQVTRRRGNGS